MELGREMYINPDISEPQLNSMLNHHRRCPTHRRCRRLTGAVHWNKWFAVTNHKQINLSIYLPPSQLYPHPSSCEEYTPEPASDTQVQIRCSSNFLYYSWSD